MHHYRLAQPEDIPAIYTLAREAWYHTYPGIVSIEQIEFMLQWMYGPDTIRQQLAEGRISWLLLEEVDGDTAPALLGFASYGPHDTEPSVQRLHKLYLNPALKGSGLGRALLQEVVSRMPADARFLELNVNKRNPAYGFYQRMGMVVHREEVLDIGHGFVMDDYVMRLAI